MPDCGRNDPCHCGSGKKYKKCCEDKDQSKARTQLEKTWTKAEKDFEKEKKQAEKEQANAPASAAPPAIRTGGIPSAGHAPKHSSIPVPKFSLPRKVGGG